MNKRIKYDNNNEIDANLIAKICYDTYKNKLNKSGKPNQQNEYTVIAALIEYYNNNYNKLPIVICLTTGTKCFPKNVPYHNEDIVDCHAESLLKRSFKYYLIELINDWYDKNNNFDQFYQKVISIRNYCLFISQFPCGLFNRWKGCDSKNPTVNRKPGRGELCPKAACIHKIAKWMIFGLQGSRLLNMIGKPIIPNHIIIGNCETDSFDETSFKTNSVKNFLIPNLKEYDKISNDLSGVFQLPQNCQLHFAEKFRYQEFIRNDKKLPCGSSIVAWSDCSNEKNYNLKTEILANGRKLGAKKRKTFPNSSGISKICDFNLIKNIEQLELKFSIKNNELQAKYKNDWIILQKNLSIFKNWPILSDNKPSST